MSKSPLRVSVVTVCYNSEKTVPDTLISVCAQDYPHLEHVIIDGNSKDKTLSLVKQGLRSGGSILSEPDKGLYDAMNKGILRSGSEVVGFLNSDDFFVCENAISMIAEKFSDPRIMVVYADINYVKSESIESIARRWKSGPFARKQLNFGWMPPHPTFYARKSLLEKIGGFDTNLKISADYNLILRCLNNVDDTAVAYIPEVLIHMRLGGASNGTDFSAYVRMLKEVAHVARSNGLARPWVVVGSRIARVLSQYALSMP